MIKKTIGAFGIFFLLQILGCPIQLYAQTVVWQMPLSDYSEITQIGNDLYKVKRNDKIGLIHSDGMVVAQLENDNIGLFYEHKALLTYTDAMGERIAGCLTDDGQYYCYQTKYYTLEGQKFFSDGLLSVRDENGKLGYINIQGNAIVGFNDKYIRIKPFTEGYAAVQKKDKKYVLMGKDGEEVRFRYGGTGVGTEIGGCTNVYNGQSYVYDVYGERDGKVYTYNAVSGGTLNKVSKPKDTTKDYLYCYSAITGRGKTVPFVENKYVGVNGLLPTAQEGLYGFIQGDHVILPCQFTSATQFEDGCSIIKKDGRIGILKLISDGTFNVIANTVKQKFYAGGTLKCSFNLNSPSIWRNKGFKVTVKDENGLDVILGNNADVYNFSVKPTETSTKTYKVTVTAEDLKLYEGIVAFSFVKKVRCATCGEDTDVCKYYGKHPVEKHEEDKKSEQPVKKCPTCGKPINECKWGGVH